MLAGLLLEVSGLSHASETSTGSTVAPACGHSKVGIVAATSDEATAVCTALADVVKYFADADLAFEPVFVLTFVRVRSGMIPVCTPMAVEPETRAVHHVASRAHADGCVNYVAR